jgi:hypothetical protein
MRLRLCLSDAASFAALAEHYRSQAQTCRQMALATVNPFNEGWLAFAAEWTKRRRRQRQKLSEKGNAVRA